MDRGYSAGGAWFCILFDKIFSSSGPTKEDMERILQCVECKVTEEMNALLLAPFSRLEIEKALNQMHPLKALTPDGFPTLFYQKFWHLVGDKTIQDYLQILNNRRTIKEWNRTNIVLIPKKKKSRAMSDVKSISLCNVSYKIVTKALANRLKVVLEKIISECQSAFVPGRNISDNIVINHE